MLPREKYGSFMQHAGAIAMRRASVIEIASGRQIRRRGLFARIVGALQVSRRSEAQAVLRRYRYLISRDFQEQPVSAALDVNQAEESITNADRNNTPLRASDPTLQGA